MLPIVIITLTTLFIGLGLGTYNLIMTEYCDVEDEYYPDLIWAE